VRDQALSFTLLLRVGNLVSRCAAGAAAQAVVRGQSSTMLVSGKPLSCWCLNPSGRSASRAKPARADLRWRGVLHTARAKLATVTMIATVYAQTVASTGATVADLLTIADVGFGRGALAPFRLENRVQVLLQGDSLTRRASRSVLCQPRHVCEPTPGCEHPDGGVLNLSATQLRDHAIHTPAK
jgi:hypothetical protein